MGADRRHQNGVTRLQTDHVGAHTVEDQVVNIDVLDQLLSAVMLQGSQRAAGSGPAGRIQGVQRGGERTDIVGAGTVNVTDYVHSEGAQPSQRDISLHVAKLGAQHRLNLVLDITQVSTCDQQCANLGKRHPALAIHRALQSLGNSTPKVDGQAISRTEHVIGACRQVHGKFVGVTGAIDKDVAAKAVHHRRTPRHLRINIVERWNVGVRIRAMPDRRLLVPRLALGHTRAIGAPAQGGELCGPRPRRFLDLRSIRTRRRQAARWYVGLL